VTFEDTAGTETASGKVNTPVGDPQKRAKKRHSLAASADVTDGSLAGLFFGRALRTTEAGEEYSSFYIGRLVDGEEQIITEIHDGEQLSEQVHGAPETWCKYINYMLISCEDFRNQLEALEADSTTLRKSFTDKMNEIKKLQARVELHKEGEASTSNELATTKKDDGRARVVTAALSSTPSRKEKKEKLIGFERTPAQRTRLMKLGLCFKCGGSGHRSGDPGAPCELDDITPASQISALAACQMVNN
jgi:hypothetical protein